MMGQIAFDLFPMVTPAPRLIIIVELKCHEARDILLNTVVLERDMLDTLLECRKIQLVSNVRNISTGDQQVQVWQLLLSYGVDHQ